MNALNALLAGLLFGAGLLLSRMVNPANVLAFLDFHGQWSPALLFTMAAAVITAAPAFAFARRAQRTLLFTPVHLPRVSRPDARLITGAVIFGAGWGFSGICPGPGLALLSRGDLHAILFLAGLIGGSLLAGLPSRSASLAQSGQSAI